METLEMEPIGKNRPETSRFKQQTLPEWRPKVEAGTISPLLLIIGCIFVPVGIGIVYLSEEVIETVIDYTNCTSLDALTLHSSCADVIGANRNMTCTCRMSFTLDADLKPQVYIYYRLTNFYQNHRKYVKSRDDYQLLGKLSHDVSSDCHPYAYAVENGIRKAIAPCGAVANSLFSDSISFTQKLRNGRRVDIPLIKKGIAWPSDKRIKFQNPPGVLKEQLQDYAKPIDWKKHLWELDLEDESNNGFQNEDLIVWMRTAALPNFRKLYRLIDHSKPGFESGLIKNADYSLNINYSYPVSIFGGTKSIIVTTMSPLGGDTRFLGTFTIGVGGVILLLSFVLFIVHWNWGRR